MKQAERRTTSITTRTLTVLVTILALTGLASAQIPDEFTNLKVLPKDISKPELMQQMRQMAVGLGVRCTFCHAGDAGRGLAGLDFPSDEKEHKRVARVMMRMTDAINQEHMSKLDDVDHDPDAVTCITCHHRQEEPRSLERKLRAAHAAGGIDTAIAKYHELHAEHYGSSAYDFSPTTLNLFASDLAQEGKVDAAIAMLNLNAKQYPKSDEVWETFATLYMMNGRMEEATEACRKGLKVNPDNQRLQMILKRMQGE